MYGNIRYGEKHPSLEELLLKASKCKRNYPNNIIKLVERNIPIRHVAVNRRGEEMFSSNSFFGLMGLILLNTIGTALLILIVGGIICIIANLFS